MTDTKLNNLVQYTAEDFGKLSPEQLRLNIEFLDNEYQHELTRVTQVLNDLQQESEFNSQAEKQKKGEADHYREMLVSMQNYSQSMLQTFGKKKDALSKSVKKRTKFLVNSNKFTKSKVQELKDIKQYLGTIHQYMKGALSELDLKEIVLLKVEDHQCLQKLFQGLFCILYAEKPENYNWLQFKQKVLVSHQGAEFQSQLARYSFKGISKRDLDIVHGILNDEELKDFIENDKSGECLIDLCTWLNYIPIGNTKSTESDKVQQHQDQINKDVVVRSSKQRSQEKLLKNTEQAISAFEKYYDYSQMLQQNQKDVMEAVDRRVSFEESEGKGSTLKVVAQFKGLNHELL